MSKFNIIAKVAVALIIPVFFVVVALGLGSGKGIVILEGYEHGVAFCESEYSYVFYSKEATTWNDGMATYVVNAGHDKDPQVKELVQLAQSHCKQYQ